MEHEQPLGTLRVVDAQRGDIDVRVVEAIGKRWIAAVLIAGAQGARRFADYRRRLTPVTPRVLTLRLRELERMGAIERVVWPSTPVRIMYRPTAIGLRLLEAMQPLITFGVEHAAPVWQQAPASPPEPVAAAEPTAPAVPASSATA